MPTFNHKWATANKENWKSVEITGCEKEANLGFSCPTRYLDWTSSCIILSHDACQYQANREMHFNHSIVHQVSERCACVNTLCPYVIINNWFTYPVKEHHSNFCACEIFKIQGCDFVTELLELIVLKFKRNFTIYQKLEIVPLGINLQVIQRLVQHLELHRMLEGNQHKAHHH